MNNSTWKWGKRSVIAALALALPIGAFLDAQRESSSQEEQHPEKHEHAPEGASKTTPAEGSAAITLNERTQSEIGLKVSPLRESATREQMKATALVLPVQELADLRNKYIAAEAAQAKAQTTADVSSREYDRLKLLYQEDQNASEKAMQSAEGSWRLAVVDLHAAEQDLRLQQSLIRQNWGSVVAEWIEKNTPLLQRILDQTDLLVQITLPPAERVTAPAVAQLETPRSGLIRASLISPFPRLDPRIQGSSFLYLVPSRPGLVPGMNLLADLPVGQVRRGVVIPESAVVWWQGSAWVYQAVSTERFVRRQVSTDAPVPGGWFASGLFEPGARVVTVGAQMLLSQEFRPQGEAGEKGEESEEH